MRTLSNSDLRLVRVFIAVAENGGFSAAEQVLGLRQSTISTHVKALEERVGYRLCQRGRVGFRLTSEGKSFYQSARRLFVAVERFRAEAAAAEGRLAGDLFLGIQSQTSSDASMPLHRAIGDFMKAAPGIHLHLETGSPGYLVEKVRSGALHLAITILPQASPALRKHLIYWETASLYCGRGHPLYDLPDRALTSERLDREPLVCRNYWRDQDLGVLRREEAAATVYDIEPQLMLIRSGGYIGLLPDHIAAPLSQTGELRALCPERFRHRYPVYLTSRKVFEESPAERSFLQILRQTVRRWKGGE